MASKNGKTAAASASMSMEMPGLGVNVREVDVTMIAANPWQPRQDEDPDHIAKLAESIREQGLLQIPTARPASAGAAPDRVELAFGHSRLAACKQLGWSVFPVRLIDLSDRQMADAAAHENVQRSDLSAIEIASAIQRYMKSFKVTQAEAAKVYGYTSQSSVSNLMRLLELPAEIQGYVHTGQLPERIARALINVARYDEKAALKIAGELLGTAAPATDEHGLAVSYGSIDGKASDAIEQFYRRRGANLQNPPFELEWPAKPTDVPDEILAQVKKAPGAVPACKGCKFMVGGKYGARWCMQPACLEAKKLMVAAAELARATKKLSVPVAAPDEKVTIVWKGDYDWNGKKEAIAKAMLEQGHPSLRLVPMPEPDVMGEERRKKVLSEEHVALATVDEAALAAAFEAYTPKPEEPKRVTTNDWKAENEKRKQLEEEHNCRLRMLQRAAAPHLAKAMPKQEGLLRLMLYAASQAGRGAWFDEDYRDYDEQGPTPTEGAFDLAPLKGKQEIVAAQLVWKWTWDSYRIDNEDGGDDFTTEPKRFADYLDAQAVALGVQLPEGWSTPALTGELPPIEERPWVIPDEDEADFDEVDTNEEADEEAALFDDITDEMAMEVED